jgi:hypothetical protein
MTKEELKSVHIGDTIRIGKRKLVEVYQHLGDRIVYKENGNFHEVNYEYVHWPTGEEGIDNTTFIVRYINEHIYLGDDPIILYLIKWYLMSSYTYTSDDKEFQPAFKHRIDVKSYSAYQDITFGFNHKTTRMKAVLSDDTEVEFALYKFKKYCKRILK